MAKDKGDKKKHAWHIRFLSYETEDFLKGMLITILILALSMAFVVIPPMYLGIMLAVTVGPFTAGYKGGKHTLNWRWLALRAWMSGT